MVEDLAPEPPPEPNWAARAQGFNAGIAFTICRNAGITFRSGFNARIAESGHLSADRGFIGGISI